jgi:hypothetical protein
MTEPSKDQIAQEANLTSEQKLVFREFIGEYEALSKQYYPTRKGGKPSFKISSALIKSGWRKGSK